MSSKPRLIHERTIVCGALALCGCAGTPRSSAAPPPPAIASAEASSGAPVPASSTSAPASAAASGTASAADAASDAGAIAPASDDPPVEAHIDQRNVYGEAEPASAPVAPPAVPPLVDADGHPLPQTDTRPSVKTPGFSARMELLARAVATGNADTALPAFFPVVAYAQVKDIPAPDKDWEHRLVHAFRRDVAEYHDKLGSDAAQAKLLRIEVPEQRAKMMKPGSEGNRVGYYRVLRSSLVLGLPNGKERALEITSMISWRGEWYVVHLHGFK